MSDKPFFLDTNQGLSVATAVDDLLHPEQNRAVQGDSLTETQYLGFNIPEHNIHALGYIWHHPNLGVVTGGLMAWRGIKRFSIAAELFDMRAFLSDKVLQNDLHEVRLENSYSVKVLEPLKHLHMSYKDDARGNAAELDFTAVTPAVMFGTGGHFEQGMRAKGKLVLRGTSYDVNCYTVRDRSWAKLRPESPMPMPPVSWMTGWFGEDFIFNCNLMDHAGSCPQASGAFAIPPERALNGGWIARAGRITRIVSAQKQIDRDMETLLPRKLKLHLAEEDGRETVLQGQLTASCPWAVWPNIQSNISLIRWTMGDRVGHGDCQDVIWTDYVNAWHGKAV
ncbi:MAG: hypothetical protein ABW034_08385 [Steroidobacteraceae bacterium]